MVSLGSVFLGDVQRIRNLSSTPPSSPGIAHSPPPFHAVSPTTSGHVKGHVAAEGSSALGTSVPSIDPALALELRVRWLEAILLGVGQDLAGSGEKGKGQKKGKDAANKRAEGPTLSRLAENVQHELESVIAGNEGLKRFMAHYDQYEHLLTPAFALSGAVPQPPTYENMAPEEFHAFLAEMESDIRGADSNMREIEVLEGKGVTGAGKLTNYELLTQRLEGVSKAHAKNAAMAAMVEARIARIMDQHATEVNALSELFVAWDDAITDAEMRITKVERRRDERRRLGLE